MSVIQSSGFLILRADPDLSFLLMKHANRWDLPKGHLDDGEDELDCAYRELNEETGIHREDIELDPRFLFQTEYPVLVAPRGRATRTKRLTIYLGWLKHPVEIHPSEHLGFEWLPWRPPHRIQSFTIDPLLASVEQHLRAG